MDLFCLFWVPLFFLFRRSVTGGDGTGGVWALLLGSMAAVFRFFGGNLLEPGGFGLSRWLNGFVDVVGLPVLAPFVCYALLVLFRAFSGSPDFANFALIWLIPMSVLRALSWNSPRSPYLLIAVPLLWTALAVGISLFINLITQVFRWFVTIPCIMGILVLPIVSCSAYWAFFLQKPLLGFVLFAVSLIPMLASLGMDFIRAR
jgi:hypothetical protein